MRYYLDEDLSGEVARIVRAAGIDIITTQECGRNGTPDDEQLRFAAVQGRCVVSRNYRDFMNLTKQFLIDGSAHAGVLLTPRSLDNDDFAGIASAIVRFDHVYEDGVPAYFVGYLMAGR